MIAPLILGGLSTLGGVFGRRKQRYMDPAMYSQLYGPKAIGERTQQLVNQLVNSPYGQQLMQGAAEQGQALQTGLNKAAAMSGFGPTGGATSGASDFGVAAAPQAVGALQRGITGQLTQNAMPIAENLVNQEGQLALSNLAAQNAEPTLLGRIGQAASGAMSGMDLSNKMDWTAMLKKLKSNPANAASMMGLNMLGSGSESVEPLRG